MTLQYNANGHLIWHLCQTTDDPASLDHLMAECCCDCTPPIQQVYTVNWTQNAVAPSSQDFFWSDYYGANRCQIFANSTPFNLTYYKWREVFDECTWRSPNYHTSPSSTRWTYLQLIWYGRAGVWGLNVTGSSTLSDSPVTTCNDANLTFVGSPSKTDRCDPTGTYVPVGGLVPTENFYGAGNVDLDISLTIS